MSERKCTHCGATGLEPGFIRDAGEGSQGFARWVEGALQRGVFGGAKVMGRPQWEIDVYPARGAATWNCSPRTRSRAKDHGRGVRAAARGATASGDKTPLAVGIRAVAVW
ncbi:hypothetical protein GCM10023191_094620 [Actinoallomurus oryzae]|uniref:Transposase n=1 Tax=Actinoallomurus oryzae TaxID=502180 RepID=A0ABP8R6A3_9ACTN